MPEGQYYIGVKQIFAFPEKRGDAGVPGYHVVYNRGESNEYHSWSPKAEFEKFCFPMGDGADPARINKDMVGGFVHHCDIVHVTGQMHYAIVQWITGSAFAESVCVVDPLEFDEGLGTPMIVQKAADRVLSFLGPLMHWARNGLMTAADNNMSESTVIAGDHDLPDLTQAQKSQKAIDRRVLARLSQVLELDDNDSPESIIERAIIKIAVLTPPASPAGIARRVRFAAGRVASGPALLPRCDMPNDGSTITHIAGPAITMAGRVIQRCMVCGAMLCDSAGTSSPLRPDGTADKFPVWAIDALVQVEAGNPTRHSVLPESDRIPDDSCLSLV